MEICRESELLDQKKELVNDHIVYLVLKRLIDIVGASFGLLLASPIMLIVAILIKLEDPKGPIFFSQIRNGAYPTTFKMYKFRSMYIDAEERLQELMHLNEQSGPAFKIKDDPRITKIGKFIRKTSLDELPQLFNVLRGDMSLVGPRPAIPREVEQYT
ncbi:MAG: sugar transferase, partial [Turicibacter sp.]